MNPSQLPFHWKKEAKMKRIILDSMNGYFISDIVDKKSSKNMFEALVKLFQNYCAS